MALVAGGACGRAHEVHAPVPVPAGGSSRGGQLAAWPPPRHRAPPTAPPRAHLCSPCCALHILFSSALNSRSTLPSCVQEGTGPTGLWPCKRFPAGGEAATAPHLLQPHVRRQGVAQGAVGALRGGAGRRSGAGGGGCSPARQPCPAATPTFAFSVRPSTVTVVPLGTVMGLLPMRDSRANTRSCARPEKARCWASMVARRSSAVPNVCARAARVRARECEGARLCASVHCLHC